MDTFDVNDADYRTGVVVAFFEFFFRACLHGDGGPQVGWGNPPSRGRKIKHVYIQSYNPGELGWGFLRFLLRLQLRSLSRGVPSSHLEKDERLILGHTHIYSWKRHAPIRLPHKGLYLTPMISQYSDVLHQSQRLVIHTNHSVFSYQSYHSFLANDVMWNQVAVHKEWQKQ